MDNLEQQFDKYFEIYGKDEMMNLIHKYELDKTPNIIVSHKKNLATLKDISELERFIQYLNEQNVLFTSKGAQEFSILWKNYDLIKKNNANKKTLEEFKGDEDNPDEKYKEVHSDETIRNLVDGVNALLLDKTDEMIFDKVSDVEVMLTKQMQKKTDKKATFEQAENLSKQNKELQQDVKRMTEHNEMIQKDLKKMEESLPSNIEKFYSSKDLSRYFLYGVLLTVLLIIILGIGISFLMNK